MAEVKDLETRILEAELAALNAEVKKGAEIIGAALGKYLPISEGRTSFGEAEKSLSKAINEMSWACTAYYAGYSLERKIPTFRPDGAFLEAVRSVAAKNFLERIAEIESIAFEAHDMADNASRG